MENYFRITGYDEKDNFCFIIDSNGMFEKLWQFSALNIIDVNIKKASEDKEHIILRANAPGKPEYISQTINGKTYQAIKVADKIYILNKD